MTSRDSKSKRDEETRLGRSARRKERKLLVDANSLREIKTPSGVLLEPFSAYAENAHSVGYRSQCGQLTSLFLGAEMDDVLKDDTYLSFFARGMKWDDLIKTFQNHTDDSIRDREDDFKAKVGPYFLGNYQDWAHKVHASFTPTKLIADKNYFTLREAISLVAEAYSNGNPVHKIGKPSSYVPVMEVKSSTGYPFYTSKWGNELEFNGVSVSPLTWGAETADDLVETGDYSLLQRSPYTMFNRRGTRGVVANPTGGLKATERPVQCSPLLERFLAVGFQKHIMNVQRKLDYSCGLYGSDFMHSVIDEAMHDYPSCLEADYSAFDTSIGQEALEMVMDIIFKPLFAAEDHDQLDAVKALYLDPKLVTPQGVMSGRGSLMSGSMLTNAIGMAWGHVAWTYFNLRMMEEGKMFSHRAFGYSDDLCVFLHEDVSADFSRIVKEIGLTAHIGKQKYTTGDDRNTSFLGNVYSPLWRGGKRPLNRVLPKLIWREHLNHDVSTKAGDYTCSGLTTYEVEAVKVLQRLDTLGSNTGFDELVKFSCDLFGLTYRSLSRVFNETTVTPSICAMRRLVDNGWDAGQELVIDNSLLSTAECTELVELIEQLKDNAQATDILRKALRKLRKLNKSSVSEEALSETLDGLVTTPNGELYDRNDDGNRLRGQSCTLAGYIPSSKVNSGLTVSTGHEDHLEVIEESKKSAIGSKLLRELLRDLREVATASNHSVDDQSAMNIAVTTSGE